MEIKRTYDRSLKEIVDESVPQFPLPSVKLKEGERAEDFMPAIEALFESLTRAEESDDDEIYGIFDDGAPVGYVRLVRDASEFPELQIALLPDFQSRGIGFEVLSKLLPKLFDAKKSDAFLWRANKNNVASIALAKKLGGELDALATESVGGIVETYLLKNPLEENL